jgi:hypothetical protein
LTLYEIQGDNVMVAGVPMPPASSGWWVPSELDKRRAEYERKSKEKRAG